MKLSTKIAVLIIAAGFICAGIVLHMTVPGMAAQYENETKKVEEAAPQETESSLQGAADSVTRHINYKTACGKSMSVTVVSSQDDSTIFMYTDLYSEDVQHAVVKRGTDGSYEISESDLDSRDVENILSMIA